MRARLRLLVLAPVLLGAACTSRSSDGPARIAFDRDACTGCGMVISEKEFAAQVRGGERQRTFKFDDVGCAVKWLDAQPFADDPSTRLWVARHTDGEWLDARAAHFHEGVSSPMGYGFAAVDASEPGKSFDEIRTAVRAKVARRQ